MTNKNNLEVFKKHVTWVFLNPENTNSIIFTPFDMRLIEGNDEATLASFSSILRYLREEETSIRAKNRGRLLPPFEMVIVNEGAYWWNEFIELYVPIDNDTIKETYFIYKDTNNDLHRLTGKPTSKEKAKNGYRAASIQDISNLMNKVVEVRGTSKYIPAFADVAIVAEGVFLWNPLKKEYEKL